MAQVELTVLFGWPAWETAGQPNRMGSAVHGNSQALGDLGLFLLVFTPNKKQFPLFKRHIILSILEDWWFGELFGFCF